MLFKSKNNKIIVHKANGQTKQVNRIRGLSIHFKGKNSIIEIHEPINFGKRFIFNRSKIRINGDNNHIIIKGTNRKIYSIKITEIKDNNKITIGNNFYQTGFLKIDFANNSNLNFEIGDNCMFGQNINFMLGDFHKIIDLKTSEQTNKSKIGIKIGNHVWIARDVKVLKDISIPNNTIIATQSLVTKSFTEENTLIGGVPAKILKQDVTWQI